MHFALVFALLAPLQQAPSPAADSTPIAAGPVVESAVGVRAPVDTVRRRRHRAIQHSDAYYTRLTIHRIGSYVMIPLFVSEYVVGQRLITDSAAPEWLRPTHGVLAGSIATVFGVNTITGGWNLWDDRHNPEGRTLRWVHTSLMLLGDAGIVATAALGGEAKDEGNEGTGTPDRINQSGARLHRDVALSSFAVSTAGVLIMWFHRGD